MIALRPRARSDVAHVMSRQKNLQDVMENQQQRFLEAEALNATNRRGFAYSPSAEALPSIEMGVGVSGAAAGAVAGGARARSGGGGESLCMAV